MTQKTFTTVSEWLESRGGRRLEDLCVDHLGEYVWMTGLDKPVKVRVPEYLIAGSTSIVTGDPLETQKQPSQY